MSNIPVGCLRKGEKKKSSVFERLCVFLFISPLRVTHNTRLQSPCTRGVLEASLPPLLISTDVIALKDCDYDIDTEANELRAIA